ncbi:MAG TPA: response regulator [Nitrosopumilaceae archaeon]|nr:response regulator [Nitrosopumilaceae archaeon]
MSSNKTILLVDDDIDLMENTAYMIKSIGFNVITAENGVDAVEQFKEAKPDLVIMDIKMPKMDGYEAFFKIKQNDSEAKIILITAFAHDSKKHQKAESMNLLATLNKPYTFEQLEKIVKEHA